MDEKTLQKWINEMSIPRPHSRSTFFDTSLGGDVFYPGIQVDPSDAHGSGGGPEQQPKPRPPGVTWDDIGGQEEAKRQMIEAIELPFTHKEIFTYYGKKPPKGILLYGPPGC